MKELKDLRTVITRAIARKISTRFEKTRVSATLAEDFQLTICSKSFKSSGCYDKEIYKNRAERINHWESAHPEIGLNFLDCAWLIGGGLLKWQTFKAQYGNKLPQPTIELGKKSWSLEQIKNFINNLDLTGITSREVQVWQEMEATIKENATKWNSTIPELLEISPEECNLERLHQTYEPIIFFHGGFFDLACNWIAPIVAKKVPEHLYEYYIDMWEFIEDESNLLWLFKFGITKPIDIYGWGDFNQSETWEDMRSKVADREEEAKPDIAIKLVKQAKQIVRCLENLEVLLSEPSIILIGGVTKNALFNFCDLYKTAMDVSDIEIAQVIATPDCNAHELHELILENCHKQYDIDDIPKQISQVRRITWELMNDIREWNERGYLVVIANSENLTAKAIKEIKDLQVRTGASFLLGSQGAAIELLQNHFSRPLIIKLPSNDQVEHFAETLEILMEHGIPASEALQRIEQMPMA